MKKALALTLVGLFALSGCFKQAQELEDSTETPAAMESTPAPGAESEKAAESQIPKSEVKTETKASPKVISMVSDNIFFSPKTLSLKVNEPVTINFKNTGFHSFTIDELGVNASLRGGTDSVTFTPTKTGTFAFYCNVTGHRLGGMEGKVTVTK